MFKTGTFPGLFFNAGGRMKKDQKYYEKQRNSCKAMAVVCHKRKEYHLEQFYLKAAIGFELKRARAE